jgi:hypothetical protein
MTGTGAKRRPYKRRIDARRLHSHIVIEPGGAMTVLLEFS